LAAELADYFSVAGAHVEINENDLLPRSVHKAPPGKGHREGRADEGGSQVGVAIGVSPSLVVVIVVLRREYHFHEISEVLYKAVLKLDSRQAAGGSLNEEYHMAFGQSRFRKKVGHAPRYVMDCAIAEGLYLDAAGKHFHQL
jgi:hypothetical protein